MEQRRANLLWVFLLTITFLFSLLYIWFTLFPGAVSPGALAIFKTEEIQAGRNYSFGPRLFYIVSYLLQIGFLAWLIFSERAWRISMACERWFRGRQGMAVLAFFAILWLFLKLISIPFAYLSGFYWQHLWGFSNQGLGSWWLDLVREAGLDLLMSGVGVLLLFQAFRIWPRIWWAIGALFFSLWLVVQSVLWPILIDPIFNHFEPVQDPQVISMVNELAEKAGLRVDEILVMDASQRTTKANAYFAGMGQTKRIVLYDNLLNQYSLDEVKAVLAHEMGHWQKGHIVKGILLGTLGSFLVWGGAFLVLRPLSQGRHKPPLAWAVFLLFINLATFAGSPLENFVSRQMEIQADQVSVQLTGDTQAAISLQKNLALKNRSDLSPPAFIEWFGYTHPSVLNRIEKISEQEK